MPNSKTARSQSVSIAGDGIEIGRLQIHMDEKRTSHIKSQILEARLDESPSTEQTGIGKNDTKGWKILRESLRKSQVDIPVLLDGSASRHSMRGGGNNLQTVAIRNSKLSLAGPPPARGSKLSLGGGPRGSKLCMRNSTCHIIQEEGEQSNSAAQTSSSEKREGWKVLRESIRQKQLNKELVLRKSTLKLHTMDECAFNRTSQVSFKRSSVLSQLSNQPMHPSIRTMYRRNSEASHSSNDSGPSKYGYSEMSVASHRRRSTISTAPTLNIEGLTMSMEDVGADAYQLMRLSQSSPNSQKSGCCPWMLKIRLKRVKSVH